MRIYASIFPAHDGSPNFLLRGALHSWLEPIDLVRVCKIRENLHSPCALTLARRRVASGRKGGLLLDLAVGQGRHTDRSTDRKAMLTVADFLTTGHNVQPMAGEQGLETNR